MKTREGGMQYEHSLDHAVEFFSKAGSLFTKRQSFYGIEESALSLFQKTWIVNKEISFKLLLWLRDCRGGAGNRSGFRECLRWLAFDEPWWITNNLRWIPEVGRWDDLRALYGTPAESFTVSYWASAIEYGEILAAKWADRKDKPLQRKWDCNEAGLRKKLAEIRKNYIVEYTMCQKNWHEIDYEKVPSVAMARYSRAFMRHDSERFEGFKKLVEKGEAKIKTGVLFPHDCIRTVRSGDIGAGELQFRDLPNFLEGTEEKIVVIADTSASMQSEISGSIEAVDVSQGMALYCSDKIPSNNPFYRKFLSFSNEGRFKSWKELSLGQAVNNEEVFGSAAGPTYIDRALKLILKTAEFFNLYQEQLPTTLLIVSDMQFWQGSAGSGTEVEKALQVWDRVGYDRPRIVYWNTAGYAGSPATIKCKDMGLVSGFSPSILKAIFSGKEFTPKAIMFRALEKYKDISVPKANSF